MSEVGKVCPFTACDGKACCSHAVQVASAANYTRAPMDFNHVDGIDSIQLPPMIVHQQGEDHRDLDSMRTYLSVD